MLTLGRRWFSVDSKSFEIKEVMEGRKVRVLITELRCRGGGGGGEDDTRVGRSVRLEGEDQSLSQNFRGDDNGPRFEVEGEDDTRVGRSVRLEGEGLGKADGTRHVSSGRVWQSQSKTQEKTQLGPDRGSGSALESGRELGRAQGWLVGLGLDYRVDLSLVSTNRPLLHGLNPFVPSCFKAQDSGLGVGLRQGLLSRSVMPSDCKSPISSSLNVGQKGKALHTREEDELREDLVQEDGCDHMNRYGDNLHVQSTPTPFSVFGRPLLPGGFSGPGGIFADKDLEPLRVVAADGREWGLECSRAIIDIGEELGEVGQRKAEAQNESSETWTYESWESSFLAKF